MSKLQRLRDNIAALSCAFGYHVDDPESVMDKYTGFGGLGFVLNPMDTALWAKSDLDCFVDTLVLQQLLRGKSKDEKEYKAWMQSLKESTLTAFYTPDNFVLRFADTLVNGMGGSKLITPELILDPAAGCDGKFAMAVRFYTNLHGVKSQCVAYEKDLLSGLLLHQNLQNADIHVDGFETIPTSDLGRYDLVATNVPFCNVSVFDDAYTNSKAQVRRDAARFVHRYYVLKGLDCLRDGGLLAYIITSNYLNRDSGQLAEALKQSRLIGAYRLANNLFKEAGTEVGTDLLVLQKCEGRGELTHDEEMLLTTYEDNGCPTNLYFTCHPEHIVATEVKVGTDAYGKTGFVYEHEGGVDGIARDMAAVLVADLSANYDATLLRHNAMAKESVKNSKPATKRMTEKERRLKDIHTLYTNLYEYEQEVQQEDENRRAELNLLYDLFTRDYGNLNDRKNVADVERVSKELLALEVRNADGDWQKADIMLHPVAFAMESEEPVIKTPQEALAASLNEYGKPVLNYMQNLTGMNEQEMLDALRGEVFYNPLTNGYEIKAKFVSGNVVEKLEAIRGLDIAEYRNSDKAKIETSTKALEAAIPIPIPFEDLDFNLGVRWIDAKVYEEFASDFFSMPEDGTSRYSSNIVDVDVKYMSLLDKYVVTVSGSNEKIRSQFCVQSEATDRLTGMDLLEHALHNTCPKMMRYKRDASGRRMQDANYDYIKEEDPEKTQLANAKIEEIRQGFVDWLQRRPKDFRDRLADCYNRRFNCFVKPKYDGSHQTFPDIDMKGLKAKYGIDRIYDSQKDCVWMLLLNGGGICDHEVGSGKTLIMCMAAHEMKRLGLAHKPMIIGLKANVSAIAETYRTAYPNAKILFATESDYSGDNRVTFFNNAKNNDYDCIIMSHDQFSRIPQSDEVQMDILQDELQQVEDSLKAVKDWNWSASRKVLRGLEIRKKNMHTKVKALQESLRKHSDDVVDFKMMGIDHIFVDESHQFKNLGFTTRHDRVAGLGNTVGSKRAFNLLMAIRTIQDKTGRDLGATFLSGTTVTNSLTELYCLFRYLRPKALEKQNITCFDAWAAIFTKKSSEFEFSVTNTITLKERFRYFINVPELAMFYNEITDFRTAEDVGIERPEKHCMLLNIKPTPDQEEYIKRLMLFAQNGDFDLIGVYNPTDKQRKAKMLYATDQARKMSLDMRMIDPSYGDHPHNKASMCAKQISDYYHKYDAQKGTQMVFSDLSTWQGKGGGWNVYSEIKNKLVDEYGIPEREIRFIQECKNDRAKQQLIAAVNDGKVRVLFGSTSMLGTGVNAQKRVVAVHHLDTPWRPSDLEQRDGRAIRKGNEVARDYADNKVDIIVYAVERSLDSYKFNLLHCKQTFINQLKRGQLGIRTLDEGSMDENTGMNFSEYMAVLSGNTDLLERAKLEKKIAGMEAERKSFLKDQREQEDKIAQMQSDNEQLERNIADAKKDLAAFNKACRMDADGLVVNDLKIRGFEVPADVKHGTDEYVKTLGKKLLNINDTARTDGQYVEVGTIYGFQVFVKTIETHGLLDATDYTNLFYVKRDRLLYQQNNGKLNRLSYRKAIDYPLMVLQSIAPTIAQWEERMEYNNSRIGQLTTIIAQTWGKDDELARLRAELAKLDRKIEKDMQQADGEKNRRPVAEAA